MKELILKNLKRHIQLNSEEYELFLNSLKLKKLPKKSFLLTNGEVARNTYFVNKGLLRLYQIQEDGTEKTAFFAKEEWWVSDLYSFFSQKPAIHFLETLEPTEVFSLSRTALDELYLKIPKLERFFRILHQNAYVSQNERIMDMMTKTATERYLDFINKFPEAEMRISQKHIASYLGITPEFLSHLRKINANPLS